MNRYILIPILLVLTFLISCKSNEEKVFKYIDNKDYENLKAVFSKKIIPNANFRNKSNQTPLFYAVLKNDKIASEILISNGADINENFGDSISIFGLALLTENEDIVGLLCEKDVQINKLCYKNNSPLNYAVKINNPKLVTTLLINSADINLPDSLGNTPIFYSKTPEMVGLLIKAGAKTTAKNKKGETIKQYIKSKSINEYFNQQKTFDVFDVKGAKLLRTETSYLNAIRHIIKRYKMPLGGYPVGFDGQFEKSYNNKFLCISDTFRLIETDYNPFIAAVEFAYYEERPLIISPDMIWLLICQGFSQHIQQNSEKYRDKLVSFQGKKDIKIYRSYIDFTDKNNWNSIIHEFSKQTTTFTKDSTYNLISSNFTTTTIKEEIAFQITYLDVMKNYFNYIAFSCGIPSITLEGTTDDWEKIYKNVDYFRQYDLDWWIDSVKPVLKEFVETSKGNINKEFWKRILKVDIDLYEKEHITGWASKFFPYVYETKFDTTTFKSSQIIVKNWCLLKDMKQLKFKRYPDLLHDNILSGVCIVHFVCIDNKKEIKMEFAAGFVGIKQNKETKALRPEIGWAILQK